MRVSSKARSIERRARRLDHLGPLAGLVGEQRPERLRALDLGLGAKLGERVFKAVWAKIDKGEPPEPTNRDAPVGKAVGAAALEAATLAASKAAARRASARSFQYLFGVWPGAESGEETNK